MKIPLILILLLCLAAAATLPACSRRAAPAPSIVSQRAESILAPFSNSTGEEEAALLNITNVALKSGLSLGAAPAEKCWRDEDRTAVKDACLLLWAAGREPSANLEAALRSGKTRLHSVAKIMAEFPLRALGYGEIRELLDTLNADAPWLRAEAVAIWAEAQGVVGIREANVLAQILKLPANAGPRDIASTLRALKALRPGLWQKALGEFCHPSVFGEARIRCWKAIGAVARADFPISDFFSYLPRAEEKDWTLFSRSFPDLHRAIQHQLRK